MHDVEAIDPALIAEARALGIDVAAACTAGLVHAVRQVREAERLAQSREAIAEWNQWSDTGSLSANDPHRPV